MPTYQYACTTSECGNEFELVQAFTDPAASECPACGGPVRKVYSAVGVVFKGSGFYRTDSRKTPKESSSSTGSDSSSSSSTSTTSSTSTSSTSSSAAGASTSSKSAAPA